MPYEEFQKLLVGVQSIARQAGENILHIYEQDFEIKAKEDNTPLTAADMAAHNCIVAGLNKLTPDIPVLSEESTMVPFAERQSWQRYWLVDPLDGTKEFIKHTGEFTVNIALIDNHESVLGVIYVPVSGVSYFAAKGHGSYKQLDGDVATKITTKVWRGETIKIASSRRSHNGKVFTAMLEKFDSYELVNMGSSLKSCLVAEGEVHVYPRFGPTSEWDTAAAQCIVEEAGGRVATTASFEPLRYNTKDSLLNPWFFVVSDQDIDWQEYIPGGEAAA